METDNFLRKAKKAAINLAKDQSGHGSEAMMWLGIATILLSGAFFAFKDCEPFCRWVEPAAAFFAQYRWAAIALWAVCVTGVIVQFLIDDRRTRAFLRRLEEERGVSQDAGSDQKEGQNKGV